MGPEATKEHFEGLLEDKIHNIQKFSGGATHPSFLLQVDGRNYFAKWSLNKTDVFTKEATGLKQLSLYKAPVPELIFFDDQHLIIEAITTEQPTTQYWQRLGEALANLHRQQAESFGFFEDNYIGAAPQKNTSAALKSIDKTDVGSKVSWADFFWHNRLLYKIEEIQAQNPKSFSNEIIQKLKGSCYQLLDGHNCHPSPLHGDLWNGNILCGLGQKAYFIDPAFYFGDRETDLAMTECFGGFAPEFYEAYHAVNPIDKGYEQRKHLYNLYHMLNHQLIFGGQYQGAVNQILSELVK